MPYTNGSSRKASIEPLRHSPHATPSPERFSVSAVIPAYNEETRIRKVLEVIVCSGAADEIIVVSDGSNDNTLEIAQSVPGVRAIQLHRNRGKAYALREGARLATGEVLLFLDADLIGLKPEQVRALVAPVVSHEAGMAIGIFGEGRFWTDLAQKIAPNISGQRALRRELFLSIPDLDDCGFGVEVAITGYVRACGVKVERVSFAGVTHPTKEEKLGFWRGEWERLKMYAQILAYKVRHALRTNAGLQAKTPQSRTTGAGKSTGPSARASAGPDAPVRPPRRSSQEF